MPDLVIFESILRTLILALPLLVLAVLFFLFAASRRSAEPTAEPTIPPKTGEAVGAPREIITLTSVTAPMQDLAPPSLDSLQVTPRSTERDGDLSTAVAEPAELPSAESAAQEWRARLAEAQRIVDVAEEAGEGPRLASGYLDLGRAHLALGDQPAALEALRSAAGLASLHRAARTHAEARLELAEIAILNGDPTTACEHWQMARMAFLDDGAKHDGERVDRRMRAQGCPTDWVLTDF